jgi:hypothetical protein
MKERKDQMDDKEKMEMESLKDLLEIRKKRFELESDPLLRRTLKSWIEETEKRVGSALEAWKNL